MNRRIFIFSILSLLYNLKSFALNMKSEIFLYLNSNDFMEGKSNSVYDITSWKNQIFLCEFRRNRITVIDTKNKEILNNLHIPSPHGIYVTQTGKIYSVSMSNNEIYWFSSWFSCY